MLNGSARRIVVVGSVNIDLMLRCPQLPAAGETVLGGDLQQAPGGKGANQAVAAARLGAEVAFIGCIGDDAFGEQAAAALRAEGIDIRHLQRCAGLSTGVAMVLSDTAGENCIALSPGANQALSPEHIDAAAHLFDGAALVVCQLESPLASVQHAAALAREHGVPLLLNPAPAQPLPAALLGAVDLLVPNAHEAAALCAALPSAESVQGADEHAEALRRAGAARVIVTCGGDGAVLASADGLLHSPAFPTTALDSTGAGDCFVGALAAALVSGHRLPQAIALAQRAAAFSVARRGAQAAMPYLTDLREP